MSRYCILSLKIRKEKHLSFRQPRALGTYNHFYLGPIREKAGIYSLKGAVSYQKTEEQVTKLSPKAPLQVRSIPEKGILLISTPVYSPMDSISLPLP